MKKRIEEADYIKGIAILGVIFIHVTAFCLRPFESLTDGGLFFILNQLGRFSVPVFFMLSGLFLFYRYYENESFPLKRFYKKRTMYILIPYLTWSVIYLLYGNLTHPRMAPTGLQSIEAIFKGNSYYHLYFLIVMVQFYLLLPGLIRAFRKFGGMTVVSVTLLISVAAESMTWWEVTRKFSWLQTYAKDAMRYFPAWLFYFCLGGWIGQQGNRIHRFMTKIPFPAAFVFFLTSAVVMLFESLARKHTGFFNYSVIFYSVTSLLLWYQVTSKWKVPWLLTLGRYSFGLYLIHPMLLNLFSKISSKLFLAASWIEFWFMLFVVTLSSLALAKLIRKLPYSHLILGK
ncbi:acyltransferase [Thermoactinomyces mirandus]|uniref:Acyltransferase n=1 Tax=Thermoactinomyces mirandus TaxID=2756294 RepID=A0A7W1XPB7_9BACL|nr:acyltransferase [Thermoactinomyces mirandus]MBA4600808.1 acyltransferase [Thermoactinomyces mirandus]